MIQVSLFAAEFQADKYSTYVLEFDVIQYWIASIMAILHILYCVVSGTRDR